MSAIQDLATECQVSVQALRKWCAKNNVSRNARGGYDITDEVRILALKYYKEKGKPKKVPAKDSRKVPQEVAALLHQLEVKDAQIAAKDEQLAARDTQLAAKDEQIQALTGAINSLTDSNNRLMETNRALSAATAIHTAADKKETLLAAQPSYEVPEEQPQPKPSRLQRLIAAWKG